MSERWRTGLSPPRNWYLDGVRSSRRFGTLLILAALSLLVATAAVFAARSSSSLDPQQLRLGDGRVTTQGPKQGYVYACQLLAYPGGVVHPLPPPPWIHDQT